MLSSSKDIQPQYYGNALSRVFHQYSVTVIRALLGTHPRLFGAYRLLLEPRPSHPSYTSFLSFHDNSWDQSTYGQGERSRRTSRTTPSQSAAFFPTSFIDGSPIGMHSREKRQLRRLLHQASISYKAQSYKTPHCLL